MSRSLIAWAQTRLRALRYSYLFLPALIGLGFRGAGILVLRTVDSQQRSRLFPG